MTMLLKRSLTLLVMLLGAASAWGQDKPQVIAVPLSRPTDPVELQIRLMSARIEVIGEDRKDAEFTINTTGGTRKLITPSGTKNIASASYELEERDNVISIASESPVSRIEIVARIPRRADLELSTVNNGEIIIRNITGSLNLSNVNGPITATEIAGSVIAETINSPISVSFTALNANAPTSLSTMRGDLTLSLPEKTGADLHLDNARGEVISDFEVDVKPAKPVMQREENRNGGVSVRVENTIVATINGGGPVIKMKTLNGKIQISKYKAK